MQGDDAEDEDQGENQDDDGVDLEAGRLVRVEAQHGAAAAAGAGGPRAAGAGIGDLLLLVGGGATADGGTGTAGGRRRRGPAGADAGAGTGGADGRGGTRRRLRGDHHRVSKVHPSRPMWFAVAQQPRAVGPCVHGRASDGVVARHQGFGRRTMMRVGRGTRRDHVEAKTRKKTTEGGRWRERDREGMGKRID